MNNKVRITLCRNIDNGKNSNALLAELSEILNQNIGKKIEIDFIKVDFIAANQLSVIAALFNEFCLDKKSKIIVLNVSAKIAEVMKKNGFGKYMGLEETQDIYHTTIPHKKFLVNQSLEFEKYLLLHIFQRDDIPLMSQQAKNTIIDNFLEIFNNAKDHANTKEIYTCGQFFPKSKMLYFTITDIGRTIKENVESYFSLLNIKKSDEFCIQWAFQEGNSTRMENSPGGLGLSMINHFVTMNQGRLTIMSADELYECERNRVRFFKMNHSFKGTVVTVGINMNDSFAYLAVGNSIEQILF